MNKLNLLLLVLLVSACSIDKQSLGLGRNTPDEFTVMKRQPLSLPPEYNLNPPVPGEMALKQTNPEEEAKNILLGKTANNDSLSESDASFLEEIGAKNTKDDIRKVLQEEAINDPANNKYLIDNVMFWKERDSSTIIDNLEEAKRIKNNKKMGNNINDGEVPVFNNNQ